MTGKEFELIRVELDLTQAQLGGLLGSKTKDTICRIEAKDTVPEIYRLAILQLKHLEQRRIGKSILQHYNLMLHSSTDGHITCRK